MSFIHRFFHLRSGFSVEKPDLSSTYKVQAQLKQSPFSLVVRIHVGQSLKTRSLVSLEEVNLLLGR